MTQRQPDEIQGDILIVDDDLAGLRALSKLLADQGYDVRSATDGPTALMIATADPPDLILLDVVMPGMDGIQVCQQLKSSAATGHIPVIFLSALDEVVDMVRGFEVGGVDYIPKPFNADEVGARVRTHLTLYRLRSELEQEVSEREQAQDALRERTRELGERVKELNCLYSISSLVEQPGISLEEIFQGTVDLIPPAWQHAELTCARITMGGQEFRSAGFRETAWRLSKDISVRGEEGGSVEVYYLEEGPQGGEGPFLREEKSLLDAIADRLGRVTERFTTEEALQQRVEQLSAINRIAHVVATTIDLRETLGAAAETVAELFDARSTHFIVPDYEDAELQILAGFERTSGAYSTMSQTFSLDDTPYTRSVLERGQPLVLPGLQTLSLAPPVRTAVSEQDLHTMLLVPLRARGTVIGVLGVGSDQPDRTFTPDEIALAETIAAEVAAALENARLAEQAQAAAVDAERQRLARELHDSVTQSLYSLTLLTNGWGTMAEQGRLEDPAESFHQVGQVGQQALKEMRLLIHQLRPPILEEVGLVGALQQRLEAVEQRAGVEARLLTQGKVDALPDEVEEQLFYIAQEALNNALRHAEASKVVVRFEADEDRLALSVEDDGVGFDLVAGTAGMGLVAMGERAEAVGGQLIITSAPGQGTIIEVTVALKPGEGV